MRYGALLLHVISESRALGDTCLAPELVNREEYTATGWASVRWSAYVSIVVPLEVRTTQHAR